jgi:sec-independent protein translocase protein TatA
MFQHMNNIAFISMPGSWEWLVLAFLGLLIFGKRLPEVGKSLGKSIVEFKKGLKGMEDDINRSVIDDDQKDMLPPPGATTHETAKTPSSEQPAGTSSNPASGNADS